MSEYWKSTPKYWCKHCKTYVRDTKLEKTNHEATGKHQGNLQRFLRELHKGNEREVRDKLRAKNEVERLNGTFTKSVDGLAPKQTAISPSSSAKQATPAERKRQLQQLADMGIAVPDDFRREVALAGDWQTTSRRAIYDTNNDGEGLKKEEDEDTKPALNIGVRKRKHEGQEEEEEAGDRVVKKGWGSTTRGYPGAEDDDLDALLNSTKGAPMNTNITTTQIDTNGTQDASEASNTEAVTGTKSSIKIEKEGLTSSSSDPAEPSLAAADTANSTVMFKKRKSKTPRTQ